MPKLFLLTPRFQDPKYPGRTFFCWHCALIEGLLKMYPIIQERLEVHRVEWPRPRTEVISEVGSENQSLPLLVFKEGEISPFQTGIWQGRGFIADKDFILKYFTEI